MEIKEIGKNYLILYDNKPFLLGIKAFAELLRGKDLIRKGDVKIMNQLTSVKISEVFATIHSKICEKKSHVTSFADPMTVLNECDKSLAMNQQNYFQDVIIAFERIIICKSKLPEICDYWIKAKC